MKDSPLGIQLPRRHLQVTSIPRDFLYISLTEFLGHLSKPGREPSRLARRVRAFLLQLTRVKDAAAFGKKTEVRDELGGKEGGEADMGVGRIGVGERPDWSFEGDGGEEGGELGLVVASEGEVAERGGA